ncbi:hypothetical protein NHQ30_010830 [Ciborinia camelliae]|nr:hypothetical protein NHQ30_010830 [Ciborinia camelliae]
MVKFSSSIALFLFAAVSSARSCKYCQCLFPNGQNCCLWEDRAFSNIDCQAFCAQARRHDDTTSTLPNGHVVLGTACNASGKGVSYAVRQTLIRVISGARRVHLLKKVLAQYEPGSCTRESE